MKIIIEGYPYDEQAVADVLSGFEPSTLDGKTTVNHVGYCYSRRLGDCIFFLPKVVIDSDRGCVLWHQGLKPEDIIDFGEALRQHRVSRADYAFLSGFAVWIYRAIKEFGRLHPGSGTLLRRSFSRLDGSRGTAGGTLLDVVLSLVRFGRDHRDFFMTAMKAARSGMRKIDWRKTVARTPAVMSRGGVPVYPRPAVRRRQIDFDEELLVIYASILAHIARQYGFRPAEAICCYAPMPAARFRRYLDGYGRRRLRQIKYRYFSDTALELWRLCYAFFGEVERVRSSRQDSDYLLVRNFNVVFEAIIDELIGDDKGGIDPDLKDQPDGKVVDHIYRYPSLVGGDIYYIGDSKYYKIGGTLGANSVYKQYTYAKNVIQLNINWYFDRLSGAARHPKVRYRDSLTEGYNITPNFFISASVSPGAPSYAQPCLTRRSDHSARVPCCQFSNRLFDRDTLWLQHYDVNFLYVVALYARSNHAEKQRFKLQARSKFRQGMLQMLCSGADGYDFFIAVPRQGLTLEQAVTANFRAIIGKVFRPDDDLNAVVLALRRNAVEENGAVLSQMRACFIVYNGYRLGDDIREFLRSRHQGLQPYAPSIPAAAKAASPHIPYSQSGETIPHSATEKPAIKLYKRATRKNKKEPIRQKNIKTKKEQIRQKRHKDR